MLAETTDGRPVAGAFIASFFPPLIGVQYSGLTEDFALGLVLMAFALLLKSDQQMIGATLSFGRCALVWFGFWDGILHLRRFSSGLSYGG